MFPPQYSYFTYLRNQEPAESDKYDLLRLFHRENIEIRAVPSSVLRGLLVKLNVYMNVGETCFIAFYSVQYLFGRGNPFLEYHS